MKIRSVLLGTAAIAGLTTAGYAADLGVVTAGDMCSQLGLSGLMIASDDNCLQISGNISFEYDVGKYRNDYQPYGTGFARDGKSPTYPGAYTDGDSGVDLDWWLKFVATSDSDFGQATATLKLVQNNWSYSSTGTIAVKEAWVGIGDTTQLMAGYKGSIFNADDDTPLNYLGLFNSSDVNTGVGFYDSVHTGGMSIQVVSNMGNGLTLKGGLENLRSTTNSTHGRYTAVGVLAYAGDNITAHLSTAYDQHADWNLHAGFTGTFDKVKVVGAIAADNDYGSKAGIWWNAMGSAQITMDMFTLAGSIEATAGHEWGAGVSATATISDGVTLNLGGRYFANTATGDNVTQVEAGISAAVTEAITLSGSIGGYAGTGTGVPDFYGKGQVSWAPGGGFTSSASIEAHSTGGYKAVFKAAKSIK